MISSTPCVFFLVGLCVTLMFQAATAIKFLKQNVMNHDVDSENVRNGFGMDAAAEWGCQHYTLFMVFYPTDELARFCG